MKRIILIVLGLSITANILLFVFIYTKASPPQNTTHSANAYPYLATRLFADSQNDIIINFITLRKKITSYITTHAINTADNNTLSFYFEYLPSGNSIGINEKTPYIAASLLKVPIIMGVYKFIETGRMAENTLLTLKETDLDPLFGNLWKKGVGATISVQDAIKLTLTESDNTAKAVLFNNVPIQTLDDVFDYLDIPNEVESNAPVVSPKNYSSILRSLYLSSYLSRENSQKVLVQLTESAFNDKMSAGVPASVKVAHKIGIHDVNNPKGSVYTDCGIVYVPKRPYILCMMMRDSETNVRIYMKALSQMIYEFVSTANATAK